MVSIQIKKTSSSWIHFPKHRGEIETKNNTKLPPTPWKFNIATENIPSQKESSLPTIVFQGLCLTSGGYSKWGSSADESQGTEQEIKQILNQKQHLEKHLQFRGFRELILQERC